MVFDYTVSVSCTLDVDKEEIWVKISSPGIVHHYHPFCKENPVDIWNEEEHKDKIVYENGRVYQREFKKWHDEVGYDLIIIYNERILADVIWRINEVENGLHELRITLKHRLNGILPNVPKFLRWIPYYSFIHWQMKSYLDHVLKGFQYYIMTGDHVKRNQFGSHHFYSM
ncbi:MAG: hypothetical protein ACW97P_03210 [Candidatus Hodarchaeales archaeon]|jgi:hypothetical protein